VLPTGAHWLEIELEGSATVPDAMGRMGAVSTVVRATIDGVPHVSFVNGGNGFASQSTRRVHFGLGSRTVVERLEIRWPSGRRQRFENVPGDRIFRAVEEPPDLQPPTEREPPSAPSPGDDRP